MTMCNNYRKIIIKNQRNKRAIVREIYHFECTSVLASDAAAAASPAASTFEGPVDSVTFDIVPPTLLLLLLLTIVCCCCWSGTDLIWRVIGPEMKSLKYIYCSFVYLMMLIVYMIYLRTLS